MRRDPSGRKHDGFDGFEPRLVHIVLEVDGEVSESMKAEEGTKTGGGREEGGLINGGEEG